MASPPFHASLRRAVRSAANFDERRRGRAVRGDADDAARRLARWKQTVANGDLAGWSHRLTFDGLRAADVARAVGAVRLAEQDRAPAWSRFLAIAMVLGRQIPERDGGVVDRAFDLDTPVPFQDALLGFVRAARASIAAETNTIDARAVISARVHADLERGLLLQLSRIAAPAFYEGFSKLGGGDAPAPVDGTSAERTIYDQFVARALDGCTGSPLADYPALARLLATRALLWIECTAELVRRLAADRDDIARTFAGGEALGAVERITPELSDSHAGGRTVSALVFANGLTVMYKPRSLGPERAFADFIAWFNATGATPKLRALRALDRGDYGWMEYARPTPCANRDDFDAFYRRAGMLACVGYLLGAQDLHSGNVIACEGSPVLVDLEVLMQPPLPNEGVGDASAVGSWRHVHGSVLSTHLLPLLTRLADGSTYTEGGLVASQVGGEAVVRRWHDVNTDAMALYEEGMEIPAGPNVPPATDPRDATRLPMLLAGFRHAYRLLHRHRRELRADDGPLARFRGLHTRLLLRPTNVYDAVLRRSVRPDGVRTGSDRSIELDVLRRPLVRQETRHRLWSAIRAEIRAMERGDVPVFHLDAGGTALIADGEVVVSNYVATSGFDAARARVRRLGRADARRQEDFIRVTWIMAEMRRAIEDERASPVKRRRVAADEELGADTARDEAFIIADVLRRTQSPSRRGGAEWLVLSDTGLAATDLSLGNGRVGIALFLAALRRVTGDKRHDDMMYSALAPLLSPRSWPDLARVITRTHGIGGARGVGGIIYGCVRMAAWLDEPELLTTAERLVELLAERRIFADHKLDVFDGSAGMLLGLIALYEATGSPIALARARACGRHLLRRRVVDRRNGFAAWPTLDRELTGGFAHGASGIAHALSRLQPMAPELDARDAIAGARAFEASLFLPEHGNWASSVRARAAAGASTSLICGWCHGAAGIGLSRVAALASDGATASLTDVDVALAAVGALELNPPAQDHLCCGNAGRIELLSYAGAALGRSDVSARALQYAGRIVRRAQIRGSYGAGHVDEGFAPTLFFGLAGIGYELLRVTHSQILPSVLLMD